MIRLFAALAVPFDVAETLARRQQGLPGARWSPADNLHVTLRFFGEVAEPVGAELDAALAGVAMPDFEVALEGVGAFGDPERMRAVWAGVAESEPLRRLAGRCETVARRCGLKAERAPSARTSRWPISSARPSRGWRPGCKATTCCARRPGGCAASDCILAGVRMTAPATSSNATIRWPNPLASPLGRDRTRHDRLAAAGPAPSP